ncbi:hypothetical protein [Methanococcus maripaludis]|uniref:Uncharacterized protein n=1 Tax=Methanococcus maripaludis TaxID=39152 RepID=A0A8T4H2Y8_METMI|nr:hypothetical protein [Methanococcus maripaludis]MBM7408749.1 hypothetical protein [Methanococcus maripaludis]MBP2219082.1 hypothetical protein [Methanococcus maripaludis]
MANKKTLHFRMDIVALLQEIADYALPKNCGILFQPLNMFRNKLIELAELAVKINDPRLLKWCCEVGLYSCVNPESEDYDPECFEKLQKKIDEMNEGQQV